MQTFSVLSGKDVVDLLTGREHEIIACVRKAYLTHESGDSVNPDSYFLRFPEKPEARIIALPAYLGGDVPEGGYQVDRQFPEERG